MSKSQRDKGLNYERKIAAAFREIYPDAARHLEFQAHEAIKGCDVTAGPFVIQCKSTAKFVPAKTLFDVQADEGKIPLLVCRDGRRGCPDLVVMASFSLSALFAKQSPCCFEWADRWENGKNYPSLGKIFAALSKKTRGIIHFKPFDNTGGYNESVLLSSLFLSDFLTALKAEHPETVSTLTTGHGYPSAVACMGRAK